jgi:short-subunit dehydrogenase
MKPINTQVIVITGASSGIGLATAENAAKRGARVVLSSRNTEDLEVIVKQITAMGGEAIHVTADVTQIRDLEKLRDRALEKYGRIDTWINNAGVAIYGKLMDGSVEEERLVFETNFWGVRNGSKIAIPALEETKGTLINVGSEVSSRAIPLQGIYSASKHAVKAFTDALRMELQKDGIEVAVALIRPSGIDTPYAEHALNRLKDGEPSLAGAVYHPSVVANAILACAENPERDVFVGGQSKLFQVLDVFAPRMLDILMDKTAFEGENEGKVSGGHKGRILKTSLVTKSDSVMPLLSQGMRQIFAASSKIAKTKVEPFVKEWRESRKDS